MMKSRKKLRRAALLCCHFVRNLAYYRAGFHDGTFKGDNEFWATVNGDFLDICVLEWCKLFGDYSEKHHWKRVVQYAKQFTTGMFSALGISQDDLDQCWKSIRSYRNKFVAHLDNEDTMNIP